MRSWKSVAWTLRRSWRRWSSSWRASTRSESTSFARSTIWRPRSWTCRRCRRQERQTMTSFQSKRYFMSNRFILRNFKRVWIEIKDLKMLTTIKDNIIEKLSMCLLFKVGRFERKFIKCMNHNTIISFGDNIKLSKSVFSDFERTCAELRLFWRMPRLRWRDQKLNLPPRSSWDNSEIK